MMACLPVQMPLCDTALTGPWASRLRWSQGPVAACTGI